MKKTEFTRIAIRVKDRKIIDEARKKVIARTSGEVHSIADVIKYLCEEYLKNEN